MVRGYKPAEKLAALGLIEIAVVEGSYAWACTLTESGRCALAAPPSAT